jgi:hypothetical protein
MENAKTHWDTLHADAASPPYWKAAAPFIERENGQYNGEEVFMRPPDFFGDEVGVKPGSRGGSSR